MTGYKLKGLHFPFICLIIVRQLCFIKKSPQTESCTDSGAENEGSCHSDQMSNDFSNNDGVDEGICLENNSGAEKIPKPGLEKVSYNLWFLVERQNKVIAEVLL